MAKRSRENSRREYREDVPPEQYSARPRQTLMRRDTDTPPDEETLYGPEAYMGDRYPMTDTGRLQTEPVPEPPPKLQPEVDEKVKEERRLEAETHEEALSTEAEEKEEKRGYT